MLRYRSYSVDFLRKPIVMLEDHEIKSIDDLMDKRATDEQGRLTMLYKSAFAEFKRVWRMKITLTSSAYLSIMNERVGKLLQLSGNRR